MKMQIHSLPLGAAFVALNITVSPVTLYTMLTNTTDNNIDVLCLTETWLKPNYYIG